jgi:hypothetical protein
VQPPGRFKARFGGGLSSGIPVDFVTLVSDYVHHADDGAFASEVVSKRHG